MRYLIIEDEVPAADQLQREMRALEPQSQCVGVETTVAGAVQRFEQLEATKQSLDLVLCDIELADGSSLDIFDRVHVPCPVVFCTAYDRYVLEALETKGVDYLLKPIERARLGLALAKIRSLAAHFEARASPAPSSGPGSSGSSGSGMRRLLGKRGNAWVPLELDDVAYFAVEFKVLSACTQSGDEFLLDGSLSDLEAQLDPARFFRATRRHIVALSAVQSFRSAGKGRLAVDVTACDKPLNVSQENAARFRAWLAGG